RPGADRVPLEGARRPVPGVRAMAAKGRAALARPPQEMALLRGVGHVRQPGVVARQLPPTGPCTQEKLIGQAASCEGRRGRLEPDDGELSSPVLRGRGGSNASLLPDVQSTDWQQAVNPCSTRLHPMSASGSATTSTCTSIRARASRSTLAKGKAIAH